jgi:hypothetical protein
MGTLLAADHIPQRTYLMNKTRHRKQGFRVTYNTYVQWVPYASPWACNMLFYSCMHRNLCAPFSTASSNLVSKKLSNKRCSLSRTVAQISIATPLHDINIMLHRRPFSTRRKERWRGHTQKVRIDCDNNKEKNCKVGESFVSEESCRGESCKEARCSNTKIWLTAWKRHWRGDNRVSFPAREKHSQPCCLCKIKDKHEYNVAV